MKTSISYDNSNLVPTSVSAGNGSGTLVATTTATYDSIGNLSTVDGPLSGTGDTTQYRYNSARQVIGVVGPDPDGAGALHNRAARATYDGHGLLTKVEQGTVNSYSDADWASFSSLQEMDTAYDSNLRPVTQSIASGGATYALTQTSYDALGRVQCVAQRMNPATYGALPSDACTLATAGSYGPDRITKTSYDPAGQVTLVQSAYGVTGTQSDDVTTAYTNNGLVSTVKDAEGNLTGYGYDGHDRRTTTFYPSPTKGAGAYNASDYEQLTVDANGNVTARRLRDGNVIGYTYDALNRLTLKDLPGTEPDVTYSYDNLGRLTGASQTGNSLSFTYDALGRNLTQTGPQGTMTSTWDVGGRRTQLAWPDGFFVNYDYLVTGEVSAIRENGATSGVGVLASYAYDDLGRRTSLTRGNGTSMSYGYDAVSRLTSMGDLAGTAYAQTLGFSYDPASQIIQNTRSNDAYAWLGHGSGSTGSTTNGLNQLTSIGATAPTYDAKGNMTFAGGTVYAYSSENLLTSTTGGASLAYDPAMRLYQVSGGVAGTQLFAYDGTNLVAEYNSANTMLRRYVFGPGTDEPIVWYEGSGTTDRRFLHADEHGTIVAVTNSSGTTLSVNTYDEYGKPGSADSGRFLYTGQAYLPEVGLYYYKARMYASGLGRFMQTDPIGFEGGMNLYGYTGGDPVNLIDPSGLDPNHPGGPPQPVIPGDPGGETKRSHLHIYWATDDNDYAAVQFASLPPSNPGLRPPVDSGEIVVTATGQRRTPPSRGTKTCVGSARGLAGNTRLYGKMGAFSTVQPNTAAIIPYQFGGSRKADLRPYVGSINGRLTGVVGGRTVTSTFNGITDVIDGASPIPGVPVRDALQQLFPNQLIIEVTGGADVGSNASVVLNNYPANLPCPTGTAAQ